MTLEEALNRKTDRVRLPDWIRVPEGSEPVLTEVRGGAIHPRRTSMWGEGYVMWHFVTPWWQIVSGGEWFDLKDLELVEEEVECV